MTIINKQSQSMQVPKLLADHLRWMVVLAQLRELGGTKHRYPVKQLVTDLQLTNLFVKPTGEIDREPVVGISKKAWEIWFCGKSVEKGESPLNSIYQCRSFYGLDAPNNLLQRLNKLLDLAIDRHKTLEPEARRGKKDSKYDRYLEQWGEYALQLVALNGGWEHFSSRTSLVEIKDFWMGIQPPKTKMMGADRESLIQRIIYLDSDRYIQIVTTAIASLYPLWFFKSQARKELLDRIAIQDRGMKKALPKRDLYIDVNTKIGQMAGLPYPFGVADELLAYCWDVEIQQVESHLGESAWCPIAIKSIARELQNEYWSPPLLFTMWGDEFPLPDDDRHNYSIPLITLTQGGDRFGELYRRIAVEEKQLTDVSIGIEQHTYGEKILDRLTLEKVNISTQYNLTRAQILTEQLNIDLIASYFPVSLSLQINPNYRQLSTTDLYQKWGKIGDAFNNTSPQLVLAGGLFLARQAKATDLIIDLGIYLHTVELLIRNLRPEWDSIERYFPQLSSNNITEKQAAAQAIREACQVVGKKTRLVKDGDLVGANAIAEILSQVAIEMLTALIPVEADLYRECVEQIDDWGWAKLLESVRFTSIYIACELFTG
ncbi:hypothetical protein [Chamaesiphon sp. VAR_48_metabat_135_sub]|uniref:hypothetical protein n=1 Tax=Chamaesiphon sp. VAR_48_metabat_135_sub TaxID=2964699 RepID=UPI00286CEEBA|nr:hypothetical protein [Chamaesiphon sp. VAR_48_metabat_135_sub]